MPIWQTAFLGKPAYRISVGGYSAVVVPCMGGNLVELSIPGSGLSFLRTPAAAEDFENPKMFFGIPILLPPNRIAGGMFETAQRSYRMPRNSNDGKHYIHGVVRHKAWIVEHTSETKNGPSIEMSLYMDEQEEMYPYFPHSFCLRLRYSLAETGLSQTITIENLGDNPMPLGLGQHTTLRVPFRDGANPQDYRLRMPVAEEWELDGDMLPTGKRVPVREGMSPVRDVGIPPVGVPYMTTHFPVEANTEESMYQVSVVERNGGELVYRIDRRYGHLVLWNDSGNKGYACVEPMSWMINAPNVGLDVSETGMYLLPPGQTAAYGTAIYYQERREESI